MKRRTQAIIKKSLYLPDVVIVTDYSGGNFGNIYWQQMAFEKIGKCFISVDVIKKLLFSLTGARKKQS